MVVDLVGRLITKIISFTSHRNGFKENSYPQESPQASLTPATQMALMKSLIEKGER